MENQTPPQATLGEFLRHERERRGITIEQVASETKISVRLLHLLESDQYSELPAKPFIRGFVNSYCRFIGVDPKEVLIRFGDFLEEKSHDRPARDQGHSGYAFEKREGEQSRTVLGIAMAAFVVLGGLAFVIVKPSLHHHHNSHLEKLREANASPSPETSLASPSPSLSSSPSASPSPSQSARAVVILPAPTTVPSVLSFSPSPSPSRKTKPKPKPSPSATPSERPDPLNSGIHLKPSEIKYKVIIKTSTDTWVRYQADDRPQMQFILRAGKVLVLRARGEIRFQASAPDAISIRLNGGPSHPFAKDPNTTVRSGDLTLFLPKQLAETIQDPFPGKRVLKGAYVPSHSGATPKPSPST